MPHPLLENPGRLSFRSNSFGRSGKRKLFFPTSVRCCLPVKVSIMIIAHSKHSQTIYLARWFFPLCHTFTNCDRSLTLDAICVGVWDWKHEKVLLDQLENGFSILIESMKVLFVIYWRFYQNGTNFVFSNFPSFSPLLLMQPLFRPLLVGCHYTSGPPHRNIIIISSGSQMQRKADREDEKGYWDGTVMRMGYCLWAG